MLARPGLHLLVLFGSRATGTFHTQSDWDLAYLGGPGLDVLDLAADAAAELGTDDVDLVELGRASAVLRRDVATHGRVLVEAEPEAFLAFRLEALRFWCDAEPVLRRAHADVLQAAAAATGAG